ncbi:MAG: glutathione S-transferase [Myxococcota bacterium]
MITLHHLNQSRSKRIIWLLEELGVDYRIQAYQRDATTSLAPDSLKAIHPLGKSPVIDDDGVVVAESGAIVEYLIGKYDNGRLSPARGSAEHTEYLQWLHFAESSAILPLLLQLFLKRDGCETNMLTDYANNEATKILVFFNDAIADKSYLVGGTLSGADIMMSFIVDIVELAQMLDKFPNLSAYRDQLRSHPGCQKAEELEREHDTSS